MKMDMSLKDISEGIRKLLNNVTMWLILAASATALIFGPEAIAARVGLAAFRRDNSDWIGVVWLVSVIVLLTIGLSRLWCRIQMCAKGRAVRRAVLEMLPTLSSDEWAVLLTALGQNQRTVYLQFGNSPAAALVSKGLLMQNGGRAHILNWPYTVPEPVWRVLQEHEELWRPILDEWGPQGTLSRASRFDIG